jgi:hypothetical protein
MHVDEAGNHELACSIDDLAAVRWEKSRFAELGDLAVGHENVKFLVHLVRGIDDMTVFDKNIHITVTRIQVTA